MKEVVVITRFNIASRYRYRRLYSNNLQKDFLFLNEKYLERRFELFEKYTFPSFERQSDAEYRWIILFHADTPCRFKERMDELKKRVPQIEVWYLDDDQSDKFVQIISDDFKMKYASTGAISARVDNDDAVHRDYIRNIKSFLTETEGRTSLSFKNGLQYDVRNKNCVRYDMVNNHFIAMATEKDDLDVNVFSFKHMELDSVIAKDCKLVVKTEVPMWVEIISETNCINEIWTRPSKVFVPYSVKKEFPCLDLKWNSKTQWICGVILSLPVAFIKMIVDIMRLICIKIRENR